MIKLENFEVIGWEHAIRGMRNPMNSWEKSDSGWNASMPPLELRSKVDWYEYAKNYITVLEGDEYDYDIGPNDQALMMRLSKNGPVHAKYRRMITVYVDITAPLYWWKEFDTCKVGTVANSCSTMHKIHEKAFTLEDFSHEHLDRFSTEVLGWTIKALNGSREDYMKSKSKDDWWQMIQLLPSSYNQLRTVDLNYEVLLNQYFQRKDHKLDEWRVYCEQIKCFPYLNDFIEVLKNEQ